MLLKLLKDDLKNNRSTFLLLYGGLFGISFFLRLMAQFMEESNPFFGIVLLLYMIMVYSIFIFTIVMMVRFYNRSMFKKDGSLALNSADNTTCFLFSKVITSVVWIFLSSACFIVSTFIMVPNTQEFFRELSIILSSFHFDETLFMTLILSLFSVFEMVLMVYFCVTLVNISFIKRYRTLIGIGLFFLLNYLVSFMQMLFVPNLNGASVFVDISSMQDLQIGVNILNEYISSTMLPSILYSLLISILCYLGIRYLLNKKMELD